MDDYTELVKALRNDNACTSVKTLHEAADTIEELQAQLMFSNDAAKAIAEKVPKWIPVTERLPLLMTPVLITDGIEVDIAWMFGVPARWAAQYTNMDGDSITHWMELPQTPKEEQTW